MEEEESPGEQAVGHVDEDEGPGEQAAAPAVQPSSTSSHAATAGPTTGHPVTAGPTTGHPATAGPTTGHPATAGPTSGHPSTAGPISGHPATAGPSSGHAAAPGGPCRPSGSQAVKREKGGGSGSEGGHERRNQRCLTSAAPAVSAVRPTSTTAAGPSGTSAAGPASTSATPQRVQSVREEGDPSNLDDEVCDSSPVMHSCTSGPPSPPLPTSNHIPTAAVPAALEDSIINRELQFPPCHLYLQFNLNLLANLKSGHKGAGWVRALYSTASIKLCRQALLLD